MMEPSSKVTAVDSQETMGGEGGWPRISVARMHRLSAPLGRPRCPAARDAARCIRFGWRGKSQATAEQAHQWPEWVADCELPGCLLATLFGPGDEGKVGSRSDGDNKQTPTPTPTSTPAPDTLRAEGQCRCQKTFEKVLDRRSHCGGLGIPASPGTIRLDRAWFQRLGPVDRRAVDARSV